MEKFSEGDVRNVLCSTHFVGCSCLDTMTGGWIRYEAKDKDRSRISN